MALQCYRCGESLARLSLPLTRLDECPGCGAQLHVCRMCVDYDPRVPKACTEDDAEEVKEKARPNFCDYFRPSEGAFDPKEIAAASKAETELGRLFGGSGGTPSEPEPAADTPEDPVTRAAEDLFKN